MPCSDSVQQVIDAESPEGAKFQILRTDERDSYDPAPKRKKQSLIANSRDAKYSSQTRNK